MWVCFKLRQPYTYRSHGWYTILIQTFDIALGIHHIYIYIYTCGVTQASYTGTVSLRALFKAYTRRSRDKGAHTSQTIIRRCAALSGDMLFWCIVKTHIERRCGVASIYIYVYMLFLWIILSRPFLWGIGKTHLILTTRQVCTHYIIL